MPSELITRISLGLAEKLRSNPAKRRKTFLRMAQDEIAMQLRALRELRGFRTQTEFAKHAKMQQSAVSRIENAEYQGWTFKTLLKVANALDARLRITFEPAEESLRRFERHDVNEESIGVYDEIKSEAGGPKIDADVIESDDVQWEPVPADRDAQTLNPLQN